MKQSLNSKVESQSRRITYICILLVVLIALIWYGYKSNPQVTLQMCLDDPGGFDGQTIGIGAEVTVVKLLPNGFVIHQMGRTVPVIGDPQDARPGDFVRMRAVFHKEGHLELEELYVAKGRRLKIAVSVAPAILVIFLLFKTYRFDWRHVMLTERKSCRTW